VELFQSLKLPTTSLADQLQIYEKKIRILPTCHLGTSLCDVFIERQKQPKIYIKGEQNDQQTLDGLDISQ
jgi:hypothetical protein